MITLKQWMETVDYRITEGSEYTWDCFGDRAYSLDSWNGDQYGHTFHIVFDTVTQEVYLAEAHDYKNKRSYRLINTEYLQSFKECIGRHNDEDMAYDDVKFIDLEVVEDFIEKCEAIAREEKYDTRVQVPIDLPDEQVFQLMKMAHEKDITFNQMVEIVLKEAIEYQEFHRDWE
jgi:predicted HicB family RNase H-like nuclease